MRRHSFQTGNCKLVRAATHANGKQIGSGAAVHAQRKEDLAGSTCTQDEEVVIVICAASKSR
eukprot:3876292-Alexandrium_andersonii.AAC.1